MPNFTVAPRIAPIPALLPLCGPALPNIYWPHQVDFFRYSKCSLYWCGSDIETMCTSRYYTLFLISGFLHCLEQDCPTCTWLGTAHSTDLQSLGCTLCGQCVVPPVMLVTCGSLTSCFQGLWAACLPPVGHQLDCCDLKL